VDTDGVISLDGRGNRSESGKGKCVSGGVADEGRGRLRGPLNGSPPGLLCAPKSGAWASGAGTDSTAGPVDGVEDLARVSTGIGLGALRWTWKVHIVPPRSGCGGASEGLSPGALGVGPWKGIKKVISKFPSGSGLCAGDPDRARASRSSSVGGGGADIRVVCL
jgi:hypothetical protein